MRLLTGCKGLGSTGTARSEGREKRRKTGRAVPHLYQSKHRKSQHRKPHVREKTARQGMTGRLRSASTRACRQGNGSGGATRGRWGHGHGPRGRGPQEESAGPPPTHLDALRHCSRARRSRRAGSRPSPSRRSTRSSRRSSPSC